MNIHYLTKFDNLKKSYAYFYTLINLSLKRNLKKIVDQDCNLTGQLQLINVVK